MNKMILTSNLTDTELKQLKKELKLAKQAIRSEKAKRLGAKHAKFFKKHKLTMNIAKFFIKSALYIDITLLILSLVKF